MFFKYFLVLSLMLFAPLSGHAFSLNHTIGSSIPNIGATNIINTPFGGMVTAIAPCPLNPTAYLVTLTLGPSKEILVYQAGKSRSYLYGPPVSPGQWLLGVRMPLGITCPGTGFIDFHGSSKPGL